MIDTAYIAHYVNMIQMLAPWLDDDAIKRVLNEDDRVAKLVRAKYGVGWKLEGQAFDEARKSWHREHIRELHKRLKIDNDTIELVLYYKDLSDDLFGVYGHPRRRHQKPGKNMDTEKCRAWFVRRIDDITGFGGEKIRSILAARDESQVDVMVQYGFLPMLSDEMQKMFEADMHSELVTAIVGQTTADKTEVEITLHYEELLIQICGAPQRP